MKTKSVVWVLTLIMGLFSDAVGQDLRTDIKGSIEPYPLGIPFHKTVNLIFPYTIRSVDRGSNGVLVQKANGVGNVLQLKAADIGFPPTNLTVITAEGALYSFALQFDDRPSRLNFNVSETAVPIYQEIKFEDGPGNEAVIQGTAGSVSLKRRSIKGPSQKKYDMAMALNGIYVHGDVLYFQVLLTNTSDLGYDTDQFRIYIRDKKRTKRSARQELEIVPVHTEGNPKRVEGKSENTVVLAFDKFTIPDKKELVLEVMERNGGRNLSIQVNNKHIVKAQGI